MLNYKCIFQIKYTEEIYQTALGNCYGLKLPKCRLQFKNNKSIVLFIIMFGTLSLPIDVVGRYQLTLRTDTVRLLRIKLRTKWI